jgi:hypothetical protein
MLLLVEWTVRPCCCLDYGRGGEWQWVLEEEEEERRVLIIKHTTYSQFSWWWSHYCPLRLKCAPLITLNFFVELWQRGNSSLDGGIYDLFCGRAELFTNVWRLKFSRVWLIIVKTKNKQTMPKVFTVISRHFPFHSAIYIYMILIYIYVVLTMKDELLHDIYIYIYIYSLYHSSVELNISYI